MDDKSAPLHKLLREAIDVLVAAEANYAKWNSMDKAKAVVSARRRIDHLLDRVAIELDGAEILVGKDGTLTYE